MGILMLVICIILAGIREWKRFFRVRGFFIGGFVAVIIIILIPNYFKSIFKQLLQRLEVLLVFIGTGVEIRGFSITMRAEMVRAVFDIFKDSPLFGVGLGGYRFILPQYRPALGVRYAHNTFVEILAGTGLVGFIPFIALFLCVLKQLLRGWKSEEENHLSFYYTLSFILLCIFLLFLSDFPNRYFWGLFFPLSVYLEWLNSNHMMSRKYACIHSAGYME
jgi:O-antigen ligase